MSSTPRRRGRPPLPRADGPVRRRGRPPKRVWSGTPKGWADAAAEADGAPLPRAGTPDSVPTASPEPATPATLATPATPPPPTRAPAAPAVPPLVFQCAACLVIVGDSTAWLMAHKALALIVLRRATDQVALGALAAADEDMCEGSTYARLSCAGCGRELGRRFQSTPRALDELRGAYSFYVDALAVYELGSAHAGGRTAPPAPAPADDRVRSVLMALGERLVRVERYLGLDERGAPRSSTPPPPR